jgi:hypothetical protein
MLIPSRRATTLALAALFGGALMAHAQSEKSWLAVPGWINPDSVSGQLTGPVLGDVFFQTGYPVTATLLTGAQMASVDLIFHGAFRYHDSRGVAHGRNWLMSLSGVALGLATNAIAKSMAPSAARRANAERVAEAEAHARDLATSTAKPLPGLAIGDTVNVRSPNGSTRSGFVVSAALSGDQLYFREDGSVRTRADSTQPLRLTSVRRHVRGANPVPMALGFVAGLGGAIFVCAKAFEGCFPYTTMFATSAVGYNVGRLMPVTLPRTMKTTAVPRD